MALCSNRQTSKEVVRMPQQNTPFFANLFMAILKTSLALFSSFFFFFFFFFFEGGGGGGGGVVLFVVVLYFVVV